jgi:hypothetical protein
MAAVVLPVAPVDDDSLYQAIKMYWGVTIPRGRSTHPECADHVPPFQAFADAYFERDSITDPDNPVEGSVGFWHGSRGLSGKSFALSILGLAKATFKGCDVNLLGGSFQQSKNIHEHLRNAMDYHRAPTWMVTQEGNELIRLTNKAKIRPLTASQRSVRGPHPPFLILDEIDEMDLAILEGSLGQPMEQDNWLDLRLKPYTVMCSTWQNPEGTFTHMLQEAEEKGWPIYRWCFRCSANPEDGWLTDEAIATKKKIISSEMWRVEYELGEPSIGNRAVDTDAVEAVFCLPFEPIEQKESKDFAEYRFEKPAAGATYVVSADWGKEQDYTVIGVWRHWRNGKKPRLVYYARMNRRPYPMMIRYFNDAINEYRPERHAAIHDRTGLGNVVSDLVDARASGFTFTGGKRADMLSDYVAALEGVKLEIPRIPTMFTEHKYCRTGDLYSSAAEYHLPDTMAMAGMAWRILRRLEIKGGRGGAEAIKGDGEPNKFERELGGQQNEREQGEVEIKRPSTEVGGINLII